jgi:hypothetical protein
MQGRADLAAGAFVELQRIRMPSPGRGDHERRLVAGLWLRAMLGHVVAEQVDGREASCDPSMSMLQPMLKQAVAVFDEADSGRAESRLDPEAEHALRQQCVAALGFDPKIGSGQLLRPCLSAPKQPVGQEQSNTRSSQFRCAA